MELKRMQLLHSRTEECARRGDREQDHQVERARREEADRHNELFKHMMVTMVVSVMKPHE
ncbi:hypothetical protein GN244_ATG13910 [Phytophthora infestans]|uniref:Uncharacterized protein n=1 Tax=Phytophthora infestans TaxID=4787 RepID=A0A833S669_PHYIN|nr:hypothetical protein GN244_ATG13910 [Phytophthora infestans]KAF4131861.1 hypothetical protein GN958_ATG18894 [Phytophthora infestans]